MINPDKIVEQAPLPKLILGLSEALADAQNALTMKGLETFIAMTGRWRASWENADGSVDHADLEPLDVISFPPGVIQPPGLMYFWIVDTLQVSNALKNGSHSAPSALVRSGRRLPGSASGESA